MPDFSITLVFKSRTSTFLIEIELTVLYHVYFPSSSTVHGKSSKTVTGFNQFIAAIKSQRTTPLLFEFVIRWSKPLNKFAYVKIMTIVPEFNLDIKEIILKSFKLFFASANYL